MKLGKIMRSLSETERKVVLKTIFNKEVNNIDISDAYPYISLNTQEEIINKLFEDREYDEILKLLPLISESRLKEIYNSQKDNIDDESKSEILSYFTEATLKEIVKEYVAEKTKLLNKIIGESTENNLVKGFNKLKDDLKELNAKIKKDLLGAVDLMEPKEVVEPVEVSNPKVDE